MKASKETLQELYWGKGYSTTDIAQELGISRIHASWMLRRYNIPTRSHKEAYQFALKRGKQMHLFGDKNPKWRGGKSITGAGYAIIYAPNHHRASIGRRKQYVFEHIYVWEQVHNQPLPEGYIIHHLNGIKTDNRPENLVAVSRSKHGKVEFSEASKKRIRVLEANNRLLQQTLESSQLIFNIGEN